MQWESVYFGLPFLFYLTCAGCANIVARESSNVDLRALGTWVKSLGGDVELFTLRVITDVQSMCSFAFYLAGLLFLAVLLFFVGYVIQEHHSDIIFIFDETYEALHPVIFSLQSLTSASRVTVAVLLSFINMIALLIKQLIRIPFESTECSVAFFNAWMQTMIDLSNNFSVFIRIWVISKFGDVPLQELRGVSEESRNTLLHVVDFALCHCTPFVGKAVVMALVNPLQDSHTDHLLAHVTSVVWKSLSLPFVLVRDAFQKDSGTQYLGKHENLLDEVHTVLDTLGQLLQRWMETFCHAVILNPDNNILPDLPDPFGAAVIPFKIAVELTRIGVKSVVRSSVLLGALIVA